MTHLIPYPLLLHPLRMHRFAATNNLAAGLAGDIGGAPQDIREALDLLHKITVLHPQIHIYTYTCLAIFCFAVEEHSLDIIAAPGLHLGSSTRTNLLHD